MNNNKNVFILLMKRSSQTMNFYMEQINNYIIVYYIGQSCVGLTTRLRPSVAGVRCGNCLLLPLNGLYAVYTCLSIIV